MGYGIDGATGHSVCDTGFVAPRTLPILRQMDGRVHRGAAMSTRENPTDIGSRRELMVKKKCIGMTDTPNNPKCLACEQDSAAIPLLSLEYQGMRL